LKRNVLPIPSKVALKTTTFFKTTDNLKKRPRKTTTGVARKDSLRLRKQIDSMRLTAKGYPVGFF
jgi:hypothetical protein